jgi:hypothetical protein
MRFVPIVALVSLLLYNYLSDIIFLINWGSQWRYYQSKYFLTSLENRWKNLPATTPLPIPEIWGTNVTKESIQQISNDFRRPFIVRGALKRIDNWQRSSILENLGNETVIVRQIIPGCRDMDYPLPRRMPIKRFYELKDLGKNLAIQASTAIFESKPELLDQISSPFDQYLLPESLMFTKIFNLFYLNHGVSSSVLHADVAANLNRHISGEKKWTLIDPSQSILLCPLPAGGGRSVKASCLWNKTKEEQELFISHLPRFDATVGGGDIIYIPPWWWHLVSNVDAGDLAQVAVTGFYRNAWLSWWNSPAAFLYLCKDTDIPMLYLCISVPCCTCRTDLCPIYIQSYFVPLSSLMLY